MKPNLPVLPKSWFFVGYSKNFSKKPQAIKLYDKNIVVYRKSSGKLVALNRFCVHMGGDLAISKVVNDQIQCHFHQWQYNEEGKCTNIPQAKGKTIPDFACINSFEITERNGLVFLFSAKKALYPLPFFNGEEPENYICSSLQVIKQKTDWYVVPANAFDMPHFIYVHKRIPIREPLIEEVHEYAKRIVVDYKVHGQNLLDKLIKMVLGDISRLDFTIWSGNFILAETTWGKTKNMMLIIIEQQNEKLSLAKLFVFADKRGKNPITLTMLKMKIAFQAIVSQKFFQHEGDMSEGVSINMDTFGPNDVYVKDYMNWLCGLKL